MEMNYCMQCGTKLHLKHHDTEGDVPFCDTCGAFRYPVFNTAVSMVVTNPAKTKVILIKQYGRPHYILVAGYVNRGEDAEHAAVREVRDPNWEVDSWQWFPIEEARRQIKPGSLAEAFLNGYLDGVWHFPS